MNDVHDRTKILKNDLNLCFKALKILKEKWV